MWSFVWQGFENKKRASGKKKAEEKRDTSLRSGQGYPDKQGIRPALARSVREEKEELTTKKVQRRLLFCKKIYDLQG